MKLFLCSCGKLLRSPEGVTIHHRKCHGETQELVVTIADGHLRFTEGTSDQISALCIEIPWDLRAALSGNKSAARRARRELLELRRLIIPARRMLLSIINREDGANLCLPCPRY